MPANKEPIMCIILIINIIILCRAITYNPEINKDPIKTTYFITDFDSRKTLPITLTTYK